jgi:RNA polymerase sigma-70 factor (ECF subfamily)
MHRAELAARLPDEVSGLLRFARSLVRDPRRAEDLTQETLARALERAESFRGDASLATWLHRIAHNLAVDQARRNREVPVEDLADEVEARWRDDAYTVDAAEVAARAETRAELEDALIRLPVPYRAMVVLHDAEGMTVAEVADIAQISLPAAKQRLRRGRMMLVSSLARGAERREVVVGVPLRCWDARSQVSDYLDGLLAPTDAARVEAHLAACPTCPPLYASLVGATQALARTTGTRRDTNAVVPPEQAARILAAVREAPAG